MRSFLSSLTWLGPTGRRLVLILIIVLVVVGTLVLVFNKPLRNNVREWRAERKLAEARAYAAAEEWNMAREAATASADLRLTVEAVRLAVEAESEAGGAIDFGLCLKLFFHLEATADDRAAIMETLIDVDDALSAGLLEQKLKDADKLNRAVRMQQMRIAVRLGKYQEAIALGTLISDDKPDPEVDVLLAEEFVQEGAEVLKEATAERIIQAFSGPDGEMGVRALKLLGKLPRGWLTTEVAAKAVERFGQDTDLEVAERLQLARLQIVLGHSTRTAIIEAALDAYQTTHFAELVEWLMGLGEFTRVVELTDLAERPQLLPTSLFSHRIRALGHLGRYEQMAEELEDVSAPMEPPILFAFRAVAAAKLGDQPRAAQYWKDSFERAEADVTRNYYFSLAVIAGAVGLEERRYEALARGIEHPFAAPPPFRRLQGLSGWLYSQGQTSRLLGISYRLLRRQPDHPSILNNYHYLKAVHEEPAPDALEKIEPLVREYPDDLGLRHTLAFLYLKTGDPMAAQATLDAAGIPASNLDDASKALYSAILRALERTEEAEGLAAGVDWSKLALAEVRAFGGRAQVEEAERMRNEQGR